MDYRKSRLLLWTGYLTCLAFLGVYWFTKITWLGVAGIAVLAAGEYITDEIISYIKCLLENNMKVTGICDKMIEVII